MEVIQISLVYADDEAAAYLAASNAQGQPREGADA
jgi:hypothetical protein